MSGKFLGVVAVVALLASIGAASAKDPVKLTDGQLDKVTAGATNFQLPIAAALFANGSNGPGGVNQFSPATWLAASFALWCGVFLNSHPLTLARRRRMACARQTSKQGRAVARCGTERVRLGRSSAACAVSLASNEALLPTTSFWRVPLSRFLSITERTARESASRFQPSLIESLPLIRLVCPSRRPSASSRRPKKLKNSSNHGDKGLTFG